MGIYVNGKLIAGTRGHPSGSTSEGDMKAAIYDPTNKKTDIFAYVDEKIKDISIPEFDGITEQQVDTKISAAINGLIDGAPAAYDTLKEISDYIATDKSAAEAMNLAIGAKANKEDIPTKTSQLTNDSNFTTQAQLNAAIQAAINATWEASY